jgi:hypothetical protein
MMDFINSVQFGLLVVGLAGVCVAVGYTVKGQAHMLEIQSQLLNATGELGKAFAALANHIVGGPQAIGNWREMPPEDRAAMRAALRKVLAEMDSELN